MTTRGRSLATLLLIFPAAAFWAFGNGYAAVWPAAWLAPLLMVRFLRGQPVGRGLLIAWPAVLAAWVFSWAGVFRLHGIELAVAALVLSLVSLLPLLLNRLLAPRLPALLGTLVLPCAYAGYEYGLTVLLPYGSWGSIAYSQAGLLPLAQIASLTGMWGLTFLVAWSASTANLIWERRAALRTALPAAAAFATVLVLVLAFGAVRAAETVPAGPLAAMVLPRRENNENYQLRYSAEIADDLFARSAAATNGPRFIVWPEDSLAILASDERALLDRAGRFAAQHNVYLQLSYGRRQSSSTLRYENKTVMIAPSGQALWSYRKSFPVPGHERRNMVPGDGRVPSAIIDGARYAAAICFDGDHRAIMRQAAGADVLFLPSDDWPAITTLHAEMARMRAIEYGLNIVRPTINGRTVAYGWHGQARGVIEPGANQRTAIVRLDSARGSTLYGRYGDWFAWLALAGLAGLTAMALARRKRGA
ncbi:apolipoprotein N-acyltransferase [Caulobacter ginsengisoli]|uniref:Apolipoprotein N-acyltransferase n=1 Tax=Caulobacter ginsengisoli TaxID=400775 RepID=A0ABU0ING8_9CAUL|nr:nitrilase-related carbon-nitrogen hydrolase [Caulobacter ginsengisoli]MDQ0463548.1 apolipoprotein N-acyltransferase [Caulobacter ginsengisoli]